MALGAVLAAALTDHSAHPFSLLIAGLDVIRQPGVQGNAYGVELSTIQVTEAAAGGVSTLSFVIDDPLNVVGLSEGQPVLFQDNARNEPEFLGFVETAKVIPGGSSRSISVTCVGIEALLDWMYVPATLVPAGTVGYAAVQILCSAATPTGFPLDWTWAAAYARGSGFAGMSGFTTVADQTLSGTLRQCLAEVNAVTSSGSWGYPLPTVDFYGGILFPGSFTLSPLVVTDTYASTLNSSGLEYTPVTGDAVRGVYVTGGNAAGSGLVTDGTGIPGRIAAIDDPTCLDATTRDALADTYMRTQGAGASGVLSLEDYDYPGADFFHAWSTVTITDAIAGLSSQNFRVSSVVKTWNDDTHGNWTISFGLRNQSVTAEIRALTRNQLN